MKNLDLACTIADNTEKGSILNAELRWREYFRERYRKYREEHGEFVLTFSPGSIASLEADRRKKRTFIEGETLNVVDFYCGTDSSLSLNSPEVVFYVRVLGKIDEAYASPFEQDDIFTFDYELRTYTSDYKTTKQISIEYEYPFTKMIYNKRFFTCTTPISSTLLEYKKLALQTLVPIEIEGFKELTTFDNFTQSWIFPIIRNALVECLPVDKQEEPLEFNPLAENPSFGTW